MNSVLVLAAVSLITAPSLPAIPSPTIGAVPPSLWVFDLSACRLGSRCRLRLSLVGSPTVADRIEFAGLFLIGTRYGLVVPVALLSTSCCHDAVMFRYLTILHSKRADLHRSDSALSQAHWRGRLARLPFHVTCPDCIGIGSAPALIAASGSAPVPPRMSFSGLQPFCRAGSLGRLGTRF